MTLERLKGKINVLEIVRQRVPGCRIARPPYVDRLTRGKSSSPRPAERRWRRPDTPDTGWQSADRYPGAMLCRHLYTWTHSLNRTWSTASNQCTLCTCALLGISYLQAQVKELQARKEENLRLNGLLSVRNEEINKLEERVSGLRQQVEGQFLFTKHVRNNLFLSWVGYKILTQSFCWFVCC